MEGLRECEGGKVGGELCELWEGGEGMKQTSRFASNFTTQSREVMESLILAWGRSWHSLESGLKRRRLYNHTS